MRYFLIIIIFFSTHSSVSGQDTTAVKIFWEQFTKAINNKDLKLFKELSLPKINCYLCLVSSPAKSELLDKKERETPDWYEKLNSDWVFIPIDSFLKEDMDLIFDDNFKQRAWLNKFVLNPDPVRLDKNTAPHIKPFLRKNKSYNSYYIFVTISPPSSIWEGSDGVVQILQTEKGLKFYGYWTIP